MFHDWHTLQQVTVIAANRQAIQVFLMNDRISGLALAEPHATIDTGSGGAWHLAGGARHLAGEALAHALRDARARTWTLVSDLTDAQWTPPVQPGVNPVAWELAHQAWFAEFWILRGPHHVDQDGLVSAHIPPRIAGPDAHLDSARLPHPERWTTAMPTRSEVRRMLDDQLAACLAVLPRRDFADAAEADRALYFHRLALFHEDMHAEALCWLRDALGYAAPYGLSPPRGGPSRVLSVRGRHLQLGSDLHDTGFAFDNERPGQAVRIEDFEIDSEPVSALEFAEFVDSGGYEDARYWPSAAGHWRAMSGQSHPAHWRRDAQGQWQMRWFDQWLALQPGVPVSHVTAFEAEAYCLWVKRRLPSAAQWQCAASTDASGPIFNWGNSVWEWTSDWFAPYPGFSPGPYRQYSQPWFGDHRELRGGAFATHARMHDARYRNFFLPGRSDVFTGFRTMAV